MDWSVWLLFVVAETALSLSPGPAVLFVVSHGLRGSTPRALRAVVGILSANTVYFVVSATGVGTMVAASTGLFTIVKWAGAGYLIYLGLRALLRPALALAVDDEASTGRSAPLILRAFALQLSNPKALLFYVAILPQFVDRSRPIGLQLLVLVLTSIVIEFCILATYGSTAARVARRFVSPRWARATSRVSGLMLLGAAYGLGSIET